MNSRRLGTAVAVKKKLDFLHELHYKAETIRFWHSWRRVLVWVLLTLVLVIDNESVMDKRRYSKKEASDNFNIPSSTIQSNRNFITRWLSALHFGKWTKQAVKQSSSSYMRQNLANSAGSSFVSGRSGGDFGDSISFKHSTPLMDRHSPFAERHLCHPIPLAAKVGSRTSFRSPPLSSIQTHEQLQEYLRHSPLSNHFHRDSVSTPVSYGSFHTPESGHIPGVFRPFRFLSPQNTSYDVGTAMCDDEQGKKIDDENSVVSLVTGSRIIVTDKRISLSPIPLNLMEADNELSGENAKGIASDGSDVARNADNDSITFRVNHNAAKRSSQKKQGIHMKSTEAFRPLFGRSENCERRQSNVSPHSYTPNQLSNVVQLKGIASSPNGKQIPITSSEILNQYNMGAEDFAAAEHNLRFWICQTILRPLVEKIDEVNAVLIKSSAHPLLKIGHSSVEALQVAASSKSELLKSALPYIIPYLKAHEKQSYLVKRCRELSVDVCMKNYNWQSGGNEFVEKKDGDEHGYSPPERPWGPHLPTDSELIWSWFSVYMDARMATNPLVSDFEMPFSSVYYLKKPAKPSPLQCMKKSFYIYQSSTHPPHFELVLDGGRERFEVDRGSKNFWRTLLLFIQHIRLFNDCCIGNIKINEKGINLSCILE
ncbi:unnamed protein product [Thelazia callipaeda]|uniref:CLASP_N domain-containing protein n=1 Tax=Thelazia callipaeda TaxID=103827 RepID=A0A0N5CM14_THECL|nr:unnamed protein product [Thelazia callipaeda]